MLTAKVYRRGSSYFTEIIFINWVVAVPMVKTFVLTQFLTTRFYLLYDVFHRLKKRPERIDQFLQKSHQSSYALYNINYPLTQFLIDNYRSRLEKEWPGHCITII